LKFLIAATSERANFGCELLSLRDIRSVNHSGVATIGTN